MLRAPDMHTSRLPSAQCGLSSGCAGRKVPLDLTALLYNVSDKRTSNQIADQAFMGVSGPCGVPCVGFTRRLNGLY